jgi:DNA modification methylase
MAMTLILVGDVRDRLRQIPTESISCVVTSPPYFGLRDYGCDGQIGLEATPDEYVTEMVAVFREVRRPYAPGQVDKRGDGHARGGGTLRKIKKQDETGNRQYTGFNERWDAIDAPLTRQPRSVWSIATRPFKGAHFATFPPDLIRPCIKAGCVEGGTVLDPFFGAGTTGLVAAELGRSCTGIELNPAYALIAAERLGCHVLTPDNAILGRPT